MQFSAKNFQIILIWELEHPPRKNPESATDMYHQIIGKNIVFSHKLLKLKILTENHNFSQNCPTSVFPQECVERKFGDVEKNPSKQLSYHVWRLFLVTECTVNAGFHDQTKYSCILTCIQSFYFDHCLIFTYQYQLVTVHFRTKRRNICSVSVLCLQALFSVFCLEFCVSVLKYWLFFNKMHME